MGSSSVYAPDRTFHEVVTEEIEWSPGPPKHRVLKRSGRYYAVETIATGEVWGLVALGQKDRDGWITTKLIDENMGPYETSCPDSILSLLTEPAPNEDAAEWRRKCRYALDQKKTQPRLLRGDTIRVAEPLTFRSGMQADTFTFEERFTFRAANGVRVRLPRDWKTSYDWSLV